ncbi:MAG: hypothetical protein ABJN69_16145 [Hellea sp.]
MKTAPQIPLDLSPSLSSSFATFIVSACNADAVTAVKTWPDWPSPILMLIGPKGSGKTHIGRAWAAETGGRFVDDADSCDEAELFAIMNEALNGSLEGLLLTARKAPAEWNVALPDLHSRLVNTPLAALKEHDDDILEPVLRRLFEEQGRQVSQDLIEYLLKYQTRTIAAQRDIAAELEIAAQAAKADLTKTFAAKYLKTRSERDSFAVPGEE